MSRTLKLDCSRAFTKCWFTKRASTLVLLLSKEKNSSTWTDLPQYVSLSKKKQILAETVSFRSSNLKKLNKGWAILSSINIFSFFILQLSYHPNPCQHIMHDVGTKIEETESLHEVKSLLFKHFVYLVSYQYLFWRQGLVTLARSTFIPVTTFEMSRRLSPEEFHCVWSHCFVCKHYLMEIIYSEHMKDKLNAILIDIHREFLVFLRDTSIINPFRSNSHGKEY